MSRLRIAKSADQKGKIRRGISCHQREILLLKNSLTLDTSELILHYNSESEADEASHCDTQNDKESEGEGDGDNYSLPSDSEQRAAETEKFEFIINQLGKGKLYATDFGFHRHSSRGSKTYWQCEFRAAGCSATSTTIQLDDGTSSVVRVNNDHNHLPDLARKEKFIGRHCMKIEALRNATVPPIIICQEALQANIELEPFFGTTTQLRSVVNYNRRTKLHPKVLKSADSGNNSQLGIRTKSVTKKSKEKKWQDLEFCAIEEEVEENVEIKEKQDGSSLCRLCCQSAAILTDSVNDDVIVYFLNAIPNAVILSDHHSTSTRVCQQCFGQAKICVDFIHKIQKCQRNFSSHLDNFLDNKSRVTAQDALNKFKRIGGIDIKKVKTKPHQVPNDPTEGPPWTLEPGTQTFTSVPKKILRKPAAKPSHQTQVTVDLGDDYQPNSYSENEPSQSSKKRKIASDAESDDDSKDLTIGPPAKFMCFKCRISCANMRDLVSHMKECKVKLIRKLCWKVSDATSTLQRHIENHPEKASVLCDQCGLEFKSINELGAHIEAAHVRFVRPDCIFRCSKCSKVMPSHLDLLTHFKNHGREIFG